MWSFACPYHFSCPANDAVSVGRRTDKGARLTLSAFGEDTRARCMTASDHHYRTIRILGGSSEFPLKRCEICAIVSLLLHALTLFAPFSLYFPPWGFTLVDTNSCLVSNYF